ncbi:putative microtubule binding protein, partial [Operophtera brumata]
MTDPKQVKVDNWGIYFLQRLKHFFNRTDYCDLTLQFQDNAQLKVHRLVLSACTEYFELLERTCEMYEDCLVMPDDLQADVVVPIVNFMYTGQLEFKMDILERLHACSEIMNMPVLTKLLDSHRPKNRITQSYSKRQSKPQLNVKLPLEVATAPIIQKRSYAKAFEKTNVVLRDKKHFQALNKTTAPMNVTNGGLIYRAPSPIPYEAHGTIKPHKFVVGEARPTRYELPEELDTDNLFENSFCNISYTSQPLMVHPDTTKQYAKRPRQDKGLASTSKKSRSSTMDIVECKKIQRESGDNLFEESMTSDDTEMFKPAFVSNVSIKREPAKDPNKLFDQLLDQNEEEHSAKVTIETTKNNKAGANLDHAKIISEVLKKYPHLVKSNKNIKLKIFNNPTPSKVAGKKQKASPKPFVDKAANIKSEDISDYTFETDHGVPPPPTYNFPKCPQCNYIALTEALLVKHKLSHTENKGFRCNVCPSSFNSSSQLMMHIQNTGHKYIADRKQSHQCIYCLRVFIRENNLYAHLKTHHKSEAVMDGIIDESDDETKEEIIKVEKHEPTIEMNYEENNMEYHIQQKPDGNIELIQKKQTETTTPSKQKILNSGLTSESPKVPPPKSKTSRTVHNMQTEPIQDVVSAFNENNEEIVMIDNNEYIMSGNRLILRKPTQQPSEEYILSDVIDNKQDTSSQSMTPSTSMDYATILNTNENIQQASIILKDAGNLSESIPIYVSNDEEYKALMTSNHNIIFDSSDANKTLTVLTTPDAASLGNAGIDLDNTQNNEMMIIQQQYPLSVSEAVATENSNIVVVYSHQVGDSNKEYQLLTTSQGLGPQYAQTSAVLTHNYETVSTSSPVMSANILDSQVATWQGDIHQNINKQHSNSSAVLQSIVQSEEVEASNAPESVDDMADLPQAQLMPNIPEPTNINQSENIDNEPPKSLQQLPGAEFIQDTQNMPIEIDVPLEDTIDENIENVKPVESISGNEVDLQENVKETESLTQSNSQEIEQVLISEDLHEVVELQQNVINMDAQSSDTNENVIIMNAQRPDTNENNVSMDPQRSDTNENITSMEAQRSDTNENITIIEAQSSDTNENIIIMDAQSSDTNENIIIMDAQSSDTNENVIIMDAQSSDTNENVIITDAQNSDTNEIIQANIQEPLTKTANVEPVCSENELCETVEQIQTLTSEWSEDDEVETPTQGATEEANKQEHTDPKTNPEEVEESIENIQQELDKQMVQTSPEDEVETADDVDPPANHDLPAPEEDKPDSSKSVDPQVKLSSLLNDWDDNDSQEENDATEPIKKKGTSDIPNSDTVLTDQIPDDEQVTDASSEPAVNQTETKSTAPDDDNEVFENTQTDPEISEPPFEGEIVVEQDKIKSLVSDWDDED